VTRRSTAISALALAWALAACDALPGKPKPADLEPLPSQVLSFPALYARNCAGCHGADGRLGASRPLNDPVYLALVPKQRIAEVIARGIPGTAQPALGEAAGGTLTAAQIDVLANGLATTWARPEAVKGAPLPPYTAAAGDAARGKNVYASACAGCHGKDGAGGPKGGSIVDASYLSLVSDQYLRTTVIAGRTDLGMPDWRGYVPGQPLTDQAVSDLVAWLASERRPVSGRPAGEAPR
jgi:mono/diheme cytochrome c family protein